MTIRCRHVVCHQCDCASCDALRKERDEALVECVRLRVEVERLTAKQRGASMKSYHFDLGNSTDGPVGFCARVLAESPEEAVEKLREAMPEQMEANLGDDVEYFVVYLNADAVTAKNIDDEFVTRSKS